MEIRSTKAEREALLEEVRDAQVVYWQALRALELAYDDDAEIADEDFTDGISIETLDEQMRDEGFHVVDVLSVGE